MSGSDTLSTFIDAAAVPAAVSTAVCAAQTTAGIANLVINGSLASGGVATLVPARNVTITTASDNTGINFLITGFLADGTTVSTETIAGPGAGLTVSTTSLFKQVTQVAVTGAITGNATLGSGISVVATVFAGRTRVRGIYFVTTATAGTIAITNGPTGGGEIGVKFATSGGANLADYPSMPDEGIVYPSGAYAVYTSTAVTGITVFYN
tara:strand:- start:59 stop:685 length:627 start_codon:yes stop_codon:yes gene_type:complete